MTVNVGIYGATGYTGLELARLLEAHPSATLRFATSEGSAGTSLRASHPLAPDLPLVASVDAPLDQVDAVFLCLPHTQSAPIAARALAQGVRVVASPPTCGLTTRPSTSAGTRSRIPRQPAPGSLWPAGAEPPAPARRGMRRQPRLLRDRAAAGDCAAGARGPVCARRSLIIDAKSGVSDAGALAQAAPAVRRGAGELLALQHRARAGIWPRSSRNWRGRLRRWRAHFRAPPAAHRFGASSRRFTRR